MAIKVLVDLNAPDDALRDFLAGALLRVERAATETGAYAEIGTLPIVAATYQYEYFDATGSVAHWYRWRVSNAGNTVQGGYHDAVQGTDYGQDSLPSGSYATLDDMLLTHRQDITNPKILARYEQALRETARDMNRELGGRDFYRHPQSGTETRVFHGSGTPTLHVHEGIVSCSQVEIRPVLGSDYIILPSTDWWLEAEPNDPNPLPGEPYFHVRLSRLGTYKVFPRVELGVRLTLAWGWPKPPVDAIAANAAWARHRVGWDPSGPGGPPGPDDLRGGPSSDRMPEIVYRFLAQERNRHACHI